jgi:hypothetical protein
VADGAIFEKNGVVAASIITNPFRVTADSMAKRHGYPGYRYAVMPHPIGNLRLDQVRQRAEEVLPQVLSILGLPEHIQPK